MVKHQPSISKLKLFFSIIIAFTMLAPIAHAKVFNAETFTLDNGLEVILIPNPRAPVVTSMLWYKVGAADEPQGLSGMAHYFEHLMFKGTKTLAPGEFSKIVKKLGGNDNAFTGQDYTAYFQSISSKHLGKMLRMEADRMVNLSVPSEHFASEKKVVLEERRQRTENDPKGLFREQMQSALFVNHPYGTPVIGWMNEIKGYDWNDVKSFYDTWYAPNNAVLVISGDVSIAKTKPLIKEIFDKVARKELPQRTRTKVPPAIGDTLMILEHPSVNQKSFQSVRLAPSYVQNKEAALALQVLQEILSGGPTTRLYKSLVVEKKKAISVGLSYNSSALNEGTIWLTGTPAEGTNLKELEMMIEAEIQDIIDNGVSAQEIKDAVQRMHDAAIYARDSLSGPAMTIGYAITTGSTLDDVENWPELISGVTAKQIQSAALKFLNSKSPWIRPAVRGHLLHPVKNIEDAPKDGKK